MSILFGVVGLKDEFIDEGSLTRLAEPTARYAPDGTFVKIEGNVGMAFEAYRTHARSWLERQPVTDAFGNMLTFDGRLDNYEELQKSLGLAGAAIPDSEIVLDAFRCWGSACFERLVGDWALALWSYWDRTLLLARDHAGTRTLYYEVARGRIVWSTYLEAFFADDGARDIEERYIAQYLASRPIGDLTPYKGVHAVPTAHCIRIQGRTIAATSHWNWSTGAEIRYRNAREYEEHFLALFEKAVSRRTGPGAPTIAHLSGGMDSSSIVCMSDLIRKKQGAAPCDLIDTISHYDDTEPNWNERPYFSAVEENRGKAGLHFEVSFERRTFLALPVESGKYLWPGADSGSFALEQELDQALAPRGFRAIVSGLGGDELLGGVPTGTPELADLLVRGRFVRFSKLAYRWSLPSRTPLLHELTGTIFSTFRAYLGSGGRREHPDWIAGRLRRQEFDLRGLFARLSIPQGRLFAGRAWESILGTLPHLQPGLLARYEFRYPYLDRELVEFLLRIPRMQLARPGRRRFMMRNAMKGIVPDLVLERKRKAFISRTPITAFHKHRAELTELFRSSLLADRGFIQLSRLNPAIERISSTSRAEEWPSLLRAVNLEIWLRGISGGAGESNSPEAASDKALRLIET